MPDLSTITADEAFALHVALFWEMVALRKEPNYDEAKDDLLADEMADLWYIIKPEHRDYITKLSYEYNRGFNKNSRYYIPHMPKKPVF